jgi:hypothetical protein
VSYLLELLERENYDLTNFMSSNEYVDLANNLAQKLAPKWQRPLTFVNLKSVSEEICYIRDLILLKFVYDKIS